MTHEIVAAYLAAGASIVSLFLSGMALFLSGKASNMNQNMFKRQGIIDLHMAWRGTNDLNVNDIVTPDVVRGTNALDLTASLWNHDVVEKVVLYQSYWQPYKTLFEALKFSQNIAPGINKKLCDLITPEMEKAYEDMKTFNPIIQTKI